MKGLTKQGLDNYRDFGIPTGDFLVCVLTNNLLGAFQAADEDNERDMAQIVAYVKNHMPAIAWGNSERMAAWLLHQGLKGLSKKTVA